MVKSVLGATQGLRDWKIQRVSAIILAVYSVAMVLYLLGGSHLDYATWRNLFSHTWMKVSTLLFVASLLLHAWVGIWTVITDYVKIWVLATLFNCLVFLGLATCFFWTLTILWSV